MADKIDNAIPAAVFHFILPSSHPSIMKQATPTSSQSSHNPVVPESGDDNTIISSTNYRVGVIAAFNSIDHCEENFDQLMAVLRHSEEDVNVEVHLHPSDTGTSPPIRGARSNSLLQTSKYKKSKK